MNKKFVADKIALGSMLGKRLTNNEFIQLKRSSNRITKKMKQGMDYMGAIKNEKSLKDMRKEKNESRNK